MIVPGMILKKRRYPSTAPGRVGNYYLIRTGHPNNDEKKQQKKTKHSFYRVRSSTFGHRSGRTIDYSVTILGTLPGTFPLLSCLTLYVLLTMPPETTEANQADRGGVRSHEYEHGQEMKLNPHLRQHPNPIPDTHYSQVQPQEDNGQDHHDQRSFHHPRPPPHPFVDVERSSEHYQHLHHQHLRYQELRQQPQQDGHGHKYDDKTDAELQEDEDFINKLAEATTQQELIDGRFVMNKDTAVVEPVGLDDNHPYPPPSRVCTDSDGDAGSVTAAEEAGDDSTSNNLSAMDATARDDAATLLHAVSASNVSLSNDEQPTGTAGSAATTAIAIAATSSTSVDRQIMETGVHSDHPRYVVGQHDSIEFPIGENAAASSTSVATSAAYFESEKTLSVSSALSHVATPSSNSTLGSGSREPVVGAASCNKAEGEVGDQSHQGEHYKTGRWTIEGMKCDMICDMIILPFLFLIVLLPSITFFVCSRVRIESIIFLHLLRRFGRGKWKKFQPYLPFRFVCYISTTVHISLYEDMIL